MPTNADSFRQAGADAVDVIVVGAGLAGMVCAYELTQAGKRVLIVEQEGEQSLGGQAFWSLGGLFLVDSPEQRRAGIRDSFELAWQDWQGSAAFDRERDDHWPRQWARAYVEFAAGDKRQYLHELGLRLMPTVGWAERGDGTALGHGNSVPRFHITWGTGPEVVRVFREPLLAARERGRVSFAFRHQVDQIIVDDGAAVGVRGSVLEPTTADRGRETTRNVVGDFEFRAQAVVVCSGGIGGNAELVQQNWPTYLGRAPQSMICGVPAHVDGRMLAISETAGASLVNRDRMWHYTEGIRNWDPIWPNHAIRILPGPSSLWLDAHGERLPHPCLPGFDTVSTLKHILGTDRDYSWLILTQSIIEKEFALSGSEQNPDITGKSLRRLADRVRSGAPGPVEAFKRNGADFVVADKLADLVAGMNRVAGENLLSINDIERQVSARDAQVDNPFSKDVQIAAIHEARRYKIDRMIRVAPPHKLTDPDHGPMIAVQLHLLTRKTLGGIEANLDSQVIRPDGTEFDGLFAAGEAAGFGGGGVHGYNALEGTFLGGCIFSGRTAGRAIARQLL